MTKIAGPIAARVAFAAANHSVDASTRRIIDKGERAVPVQVTHMYDIGFRQGHHDITVRMRSGKCLIASGLSFSCKVVSREKTSDGIAPAGDFGKLKSQSSTL
jgi:hypothetical protein